MGSAQFLAKDGYDYCELTVDASSLTGYIRLPPLGRKPWKVSQTCTTKLLLLYGEISLSLRKSEEKMELGHHVTINKGRLDETSKWFAISFCDSISGCVYTLHNPNAIPALLLYVELYGSVHQDK
jgi:hypothetical protein